MTKTIATFTLPEKDLTARVVHHEYSASFIAESYEIIVVDTTGAMDDCTRKFEAPNAKAKAMAAFADFVREVV